MATAYALRLCPHLIVLPVNMNKYREVASIIHGIFKEFTDLVEPLSLDEAYLDVTNSFHCQGSATLIAKEIQQKIWSSVKLTASAGVSSNKLLAKIASGWKKPNGLFVIRPQEIESFVKNLAIEELFGVGKVTANKLHSLGLKTCSDLQKLSLEELKIHFREKSGMRLYEQCRGIDHRVVESNKIRKSLSVEETFNQDINLDDHCISILKKLYDRLLTRIKKYETDRKIRNQCIKIKLSNFKTVTIERSSRELNFQLFDKLLVELSERQYGKIRLMGIGVHF